MNLEDVHLRGTRASQPAAATVAEGSIYCVTDEGDILEMRDSTIAWVAYSPAVVTGGITQLTSDITAGPGSGSQAATIANNAVTNTKAADMAQATIKGRAAAAGTGDPTDLTPNQVSTILDGATDPFLRTSAAGSPGITTLTGDVAAGPGSGSQAATIANDAVTDAKLRNSGALSVIGRASNSSGDPADISAGADDRLLTRIASALAWTQLTIGMAAANLWTFAKLQQIATGKVLGRGSASTGDIEELTPTSGIETTSTPGLRLTTAARTRALTVFIGDGTNVITTGVKGYIQCPYTGTITKAAIIASDAAFTSGAIVVDIWKDTFANRPPTDSDSITSSTPPTITATGTGSEDSTLSSWITSVTAGDFLGFNVDSVTSMKQVMLQLTIVVTG